MTRAPGVREMVMACAVWDPGEAQRERVRAGAAQLRDWGALLQCLRMHRLVPHAQRALSASRAAVPDAAARELAGESTAIAARALGRAQQLAALARLFDAAGVRALAFKGPALSLAAYGDVGARDSIDLDIVVRPGQLDRASEAMVSAGYVSRAGMSVAQERMLQRSFGHFSYAREGAPAGVELHWRFAAPRYPWSMPADDVFSRAGTIDVAGAGIAVAAPTDEALLQAMHGARHQWERLEWLVTFERLLRRPAVDPAALVARARAHGSDRALRVALWLSADVLGARLAPGLAAVASDAATGELGAEIARRIDRGLETGAEDMRQPYALNLRLMDRASDRARYLALSIFLPTVREWELVRLPDALLPLYYPVRLLRVLALRVKSLFVRR